MSRSVKSYNSSLSRKEKAAKQQQNAQIKQKIKEILHSVKEQRQHIENRLHQNDIQIQKLKQDYELLRYENDFDNPSTQQETILHQLAEGLKELSIDPIQIIGHCPTLNGMEQVEGRKLSKQQIIRVQQVLMARLQSQLYK